MMFQNSNWGFADIVSKSYSNFVEMQKRKILCKTETLITVEKESEANKPHMTSTYIKS